MSQDASEREPPKRRWLNERMEYSLRMYEYYTRHTNTIFNFYLVLSGLLVTAYVQAFSQEINLHPAGAAIVALAGIILSDLFHKIDVNSRNMMRRIHRDLKEVERVIYERSEEAGDGRGFLTRKDEPPSESSEEGHGFWFGCVFGVNLLLFGGGFVFGLWHLIDLGECVAAYAIGSLAFALFGFDLLYLRRRGPQPFNPKDDI
jgi:hypothetical protein